mmetsp:Transcript_6516/g.9641  ORF Transcript_6516/g.9641 Transcript_6516/m.9641 type:complete len:80 (-) Transcript_6516:231-470(-)
MDDTISSLQEAKNNFAKSQIPPIEPCTNDKCGYSGCVCGHRCGCNVQNPSILLSGCDPCEEYKKKMKAQSNPKGGAKKA